MCGLTVIFSYHPEAFPVDGDELLCIHAAMRNRGPDDEGLWISSDRRIGLAHRRLAIIDLSTSGAQPMATPEGSVRVVFNGEIYNHRELRKELEAKGCRFYSHSDTEVLLHLYQAHGRDMVHHLRGMYAFAIWDECRRGLFLARDPFGIKPLYYADDGNTIRVASQVKALLKGGRIDTTPEPAGHVGFYLWGHVPEPYTLYKGIRALPAGTSLWINSAGQKETQQYFNIATEIAQASTTRLTLTREEVRERLRAALLDSVRHHLIADVPVGIFLSAGLDSTTLVALAKDAGTKDLRTVTLGFKEFQGTPSDEVPLAEVVARHYNATHHTQWVTKDDFQSEFQRLMGAMDQPSIDGVNTYFVSKAAADAGLKVALSGLGGDELFGGYSSFQAIPRMVRLLRPFAAIPGLGRGLRAMSSPVLKYFTSPKAAGLLEHGGTYGGAYLLRRGLFMPWELPDLLDGNMARQGWEELQTLSRLERTTQGTDNANRKVAALETAWYMRNQLLRDADWASMAHSLELRIPLVDIELFKTVAGMVAAGIPLTKRDMACTPALPLPDAVLNRKKTGFSIPVQEWMPKSAAGYGRKTTRGIRQWAELLIRQSQFQSAAGTARHINPMTVGLLASEICTRGGIQSFMVRIVEAMTSLASSQASESHCFSLNDQTKELRMIPSLAELSGEWGADRSKVRLASHLLFAQPRFDILVVGHIGMAPLALAMKLSGRLRSYLVQLHGIEAWRKVSLPERLALLGAARILATTRYTAQECARLNRIPDDRFQIIPLCANEQKLVPTPQFRLNGTFKLLCVARQDASERYKGFEMLLDTLATLKTTQPDIHLNLVGSGDDQSRLRTLVDELSLAAHVTFCGSLSDADLVAAYQDCDVFVMPSKKEGFGIVFLEAMRFGKPCIGGNHGGTPDVIEHGKSGYLVEYGDVSGLAAMILTLVRDAGLRRRMGEAGRYAVETRFSHARFVASYHRLFEDLAADGVR